MRGADYKAALLGLATAIETLVAFLGNDAPINVTAPLCDTARARGGLILCWTVPDFNFLSVRRSPVNAYLTGVHLDSCSSTSNRLGHFLFNRFFPRRIFGINSRLNLVGKALLRQGVLHDNSGGVVSDFGA